MGPHNVLNSVGAIALCLQIGISTILQKNTDEVYWNTEEANQNFRI